MIQGLISDLQLLCFVFIILALFLINNCCYICSSFILRHSMDSVQEISQDITPFCKAKSHWFRRYAEVMCITEHRYGCRDQSLRYLNVQHLTYSSGGKGIHVHFLEPFASLMSGHFIQHYSSSILLQNKWRHVNMRGN